MVLNEGTSEQRAQRSGGESEQICGPLRAPSNRPFLLSLALCAAFCLSVPGPENTYINACLCMPHGTDAADYVLMVSARVFISNAQLAANN